MTGLVRALCVGAMALLSAGCASLGLGGLGNRDSVAAYSGLTATASSVRLGTVVNAAEVCPAQARSESVFAALLSFGAEYLVNMVGNAIEESKSRLNGQFAGSGVMPGDTARVQCLIIAHGLIGEPPANWDEAGRSRFRLSRAQMSALHLADAPGFYMEARVERVGDAAVVLHPQYLHYAQTSARNRGSGRKNVALVIGIGEADADAAADSGDDDFDAVYRFNLGELQVGRFYEQNQLAGLSSSQQIEPSNLSSANIAVFVTESEDPSLALRTLSETFTSNKDALQTAIEEAVTNALGQDD